MHKNWEAPRNHYGIWVLFCAKRGGFLMMLDKILRRKLSFKQLCIIISILYSSLFMVGLFMKPFWISTFFIFLISTIIAASGKRMFQTHSKNKTYSVHSIILHLIQTSKRICKLFISIIQSFNLIRLSSIMIFLYLINQGVLTSIFDGQLSIETKLYIDSTLSPFAGDLFNFFGFSIVMYALFKLSFRVLKNTDDLDVIRKVEAEDIDLPFKHHSGQLRLDVDTLLDTLYTSKRMDLYFLVKENYSSLKDVQKQVKKSSSIEDFLISLEEQTKEPQA